MSDLGRLPADPEGFFELDQGYDRRDLKRAYAKALRIYKPESHPAEFGLIRDAYERLERALRYGRQRQSQDKFADAWQQNTAKTIYGQSPHSQAADTDPDTAASVRPPDSKRHPRPNFATDSDRPQTTNRPHGRPTKSDGQLRPETLPLKTLAVINPTSTLRRLEKQSRRTPPDYYLAAVLADATAGKPTAKYLGHLLDGLQVYTSDPRLINLTTEFLRTEVPDTLLLKFVAFVAEKIRDPVFYMLTESLWLRIVGQFPFDQWQPLLTKCEGKVRQTDPLTRAVFYLRLVRSAIWGAPPDWVQSVIAELESESAQLHDSAQAELDFLDQVRKVLRASGSSSRSPHPLRQDLLEAVRLSCQPETPNVTAKTLTLLDRMARDASGLREAFPMETSEGDQPWVAMTYAIAEQYLSVLDDSDTADTQQMDEQTQSLVLDLKATSAPIVTAVTREPWILHLLPLAFWVILTMPVGSACWIALTHLLFGVLSTAGFWISLIGVVATLVGSLVSFYWLVDPKLFRKKREAKRRVAIDKAYGQQWRSRLFRYVGSTNQPIQLIVYRIEQIDGGGRRSTLAEHVANLVNRDVGLFVYSALQSLVR